MKNLYTVLSLVPAPLFLAFGLWSLFGNHSQVCSHFPYEMTIMWFVMFIAHLSPWIFWYQLRSYRPGQTLPVKQQ